MKPYFLALLTAAFSLGGCAVPHASLTTKTAAAPKNEPKMHTFSLKDNFGKFLLPKSFKEVRTADQCRLFVYEPLAFSDVDITVKMKATPGKKDFGGGILFRYNDPQNYYCVRYNPGSNNFRFYKSIKGDRARFANRTVRLKDKTAWHELRLIARGDLVEAYLDGKRILYREDEILKAGKVGLWVRGEEPKTEFADLVIRQ